MRTLDEVQATLQIAKLNVDDLKPVIHCLSFGENVSSGDYCLMELDDTLCKHIEAGKSLVIRGDKDEHAVLCSEDKTYDLKIADTSNLLLFIPDCKTPDHFPEDRPCQNLIPSRYSTDDLLERIQASEQELLNQLQLIHACEIEGYWRILEFDYEMKIVGHITQLVDSESWSFSKVPLSVCLEELGPLEPKELIEHCLNCYGKRYTAEVGEIYFALNEDKVCRATAQMLLQNAVKFNLSEFQEVWQQSVPEGMTTRLDQLKGLALVDRSSRPETIFLLKVEDLPEDTQERFNCLFGMREKWTEESVSPYIQDLCGEKQTIGALLTKYSRTSMQNGVKVYSSRRPVAT